MGSIFDASYGVVMSFIWLVIYKYSLNPFTPVSVNDTKRFTHQ